MWGQPTAYSLLHQPAHPFFDLANPPGYRRMPLQAGLSGNLRGRLSVAKGDQDPLARPIEARQQIPRVGRPHEWH